MTIKIADLTFVDVKNGEPIQGEELPAAIYLFEENPGPEYVLIDEYLADSKARYAKVDLVKDQKKDERKGGKPQASMKIPVQIASKDLTIWAVCSHEQISWKKIEETIKGKHVSRGTKIALKESLKKTAAGTWIVPVDFSGDALTPSGKCEIESIFQVRERMPNEDGRLMVVAADATVKDTIGFGSANLGKLPETIESWRKTAKAGGMRAYAKGYKPEDETHPPKWKIGGGVAIVAVHGGKAAFKPQPQILRVCASKAHVFSASGNGVALEVKQGEEFKLKWIGSNGLDAAAKATKYTITGHSCTGKTKKLSLEVYPSDAVGSVFSIDGEKSVVGKIGEIAEKAKDLLKFAGVEVSWKMGGGWEVMSGWREDAESWQAYFANSFSVNFYVGFGLEITALSVAMLCGIPPAISEYVGDIRLFVTFEGSIKATGTLEARQWPTKSGTDNVGLVNIVASAGFAIGLKAFIGKPGVLGAQIIADLTVGVKLRLGAKYDNGLSVDGAMGYEPGVISVRVQLDVLVWKREKTLGKLELWAEGDWGKFGPVQLTGKKEG
jgi:hypothetical protein